MQKAEGGRAETIDDSRVDFLVVVAAVQRGRGNAVVAQVAFTWEFENLQGFWCSVIGFFSPTSTYQDDKIYTVLRTLNMSFSFTFVG